MKKFLAAVIAVMMAFTLILPAMAESGLAGSVGRNNPPAEALPEAAADLNEALNVPGGALTFVSEGTYPWVVEEDWAKSTNEGIASSESTVSTTVTAVEGDIVQFDFISAGEGSNPTYDWDNLKFKIDGVEIIHWSLHNEWETYAQELEAGEHTLSWVYKKDSSVNPTPDVAKLDNVYVGAPVEPNEIIVEDLTVPGNRHAQLIWEVLPVAAFDKSVTFAIADETIAAIDEDGVVAGIAEGETTVTVTSVAVPEVFGTATITVTEVLPELTLDSVLNVEGGELHFETGDPYPWVVPETAPVGQEYAKSSNEGVHNSSSTITAAVTANEGDILQFDFQCWGEGAYSTHWDKLQLKIDGNVIIDWGEGPKEWTTYATALTAGGHNIEWTYSKDGSGHKEGDHALLDNIYVGQPPLPEEIQVNPIEVPAGRHATATYTVLPPEAFDKSVTFATADEAIATVDAFGVVTGIAEGETNLIVTSVADPTVSGTAVITVTEALPTTWLNGYMAYDPAGTSDIWGQFADYDPSTVENKGAMETTFAAAFAGGKVYGFTYDGDAGSGDFYIMDPANGYTVSYPGYNPGIGVFGMAYDHAGDKMYALCPSPTDPDNSRALYEVNLAVGSLQYVADLDAGGETIMTLAITTDGNAYGLTYADENFGGGISELYSINLETGACTLIGSTGLGLAYVQSMTWDHNTNQLFWAQYAHDGSSGLYTIDVNTGAVTPLGTIGTGAEVTGLFTIDALEIPPIEMPDCTISFMDGVTGEEIEGSYIVEAGTVLDPEDFPEAPDHTDVGLEFTGWDYDGHAVYQDTVVTALYYDPNAIGFYFETDPATEGWTWEDHDGDGYNWQWMDSIDGWGCPEGQGCMNSQSFVNYVGPLTPDNWLISPTVPGGGSMSFMLCAQDGLYADENIGVYASADGGETWSEELGYFTPKAPGANFTFTVNLAEFAGMNIKLAFRHYDSCDAFSVNLDAVEVSAGGGEVPPTEEPPTAEPPTEEPPAPPVGEVISYYFETDPALDGWITKDEDGDGNNWDWNLAPEHQGELYTVPEGEGCMISFSYINDGFGGGTPVTPDNWLISPEVAGGGSVSFKIVGQDPGWASEIVGVYASADGGNTWSDELGYFTATGSVQTLTVDLADFAGMNIKLAFRHYDVTDQFCLNLDAVEVTTPGEEPPTEEPPTEEPPTEEPPTEEPPTEEPGPQEGDVIFDIRNPETEDGLYYALPGETVAVDLTVTGEYAAHGTIIWLDYDPEMLVVDHIDNGPVLTEDAVEIGALVQLDYETIPGSIRLGIVCPEDPLTQEGLVYTVYFVVDEAVPADTVIPLTLNIEEFYNVPIGEPETEIPTFVYNSSIVVGEEPVPPAEIIGFYFETDPELEGWTWEDHDGDGENWLWNTEYSAIEGTGCMLSHSYGWGGDLTPDNWLISPTVPGGTEVNFFIATTYDWFVLDPIGVYVSTDDGATWSEELGYFEATVTPQVCNVDLSAYASQDIKIAFRHYDVTGGWELQLDKVLVGHPAPPTEIIVQDVNVPVGRKANVNYTVLPEDILNKNVTFTIADETIATVDEFGKVTGVAEGVTEIIVASVVDPEVFGTATVTVTPELPTTWLNGYIAWDPIGTSYIWGQFSDADPSAVEEMGAMLDTFGGAFAGGKVYGYLQSGDFYITDVTEAPYTTVYPGTKADVLVYAMAYDHANDIMYAFAQDPNTYSTNIYTVDLAIGTLTYVTPILSGEEMIFTLAIDGEGNAYGINSGDDARLWDIDLATGECTLIGSTGHALYYVQGMTWDFNSNMIYWAQYCDDANNGLCIVNPATGETSECGPIGGAAEVTALWIWNDLEIPEIVMPDFDITFMDGFTGEEIPGGYTVEGGTVLDPEDFPEPPEHEGLEFTGWDYDGHAIYADTVITANYRDPNAMGWYFETDPAVDGWTWEDHDGDGNNWQWISTAIDPGYAGWGFPEGQGCMNSQSYINYVGPLTPDNWLISPEVPGGGMMSFMLCAQDGGYADEHIGVYVSADGGETWSEELGYFTPKDPGAIFTFTVSLAEYADMNIKLAFRHYDSTDAFSVNLDAVEVSAGGEVPPTEEPPTEEPPTEEPPTEVPPTEEPVPQEGDVIFDIRNPETEDGLYYALPGETVVVNLTVTGEYAAHGANIWFDYDPEMLTVDHVDKGEVLTENAAEIGALVLLDYETIPGSIRLGVTAAVDPLTQEGVIYTVYFVVGEAVPMDTVIPLDLNIKEFVNMPIGEPATEIPTFAYDGSIVVGEEPVPPTEPPTEEPPTEEPPTEEPVPQEGDVIFDVRNPETEDGLYYALPGETVAVNLTVTGEYAAHGANIQLDYDPEMLTVDHIEKGPVLTENAADIGALVVLDYTTIPGSIRLGIVCSDSPLTQEGIIYTVYFVVGEAVPMDTVIPLDLNIKEFVNMPIGEPTTAIPTFAYDGSIVVGEAPVPPTEPPTEEPPTEEPPTEEPPTEEPPTEEPPTETPTEPPTPPPHTGFISLVGAGIAAILAGAGVVLFRRKRS